MAYQIDFTASNYVNRSRRKLFLRLLLLASVAGAAYVVYDGYTTYNQPTLNMKLAEYEAVALPIEEMNKAWDEAEKEHKAMMRYYRLLWAANPTSFLQSMVSTNAPRLSRGFLPVDWALTTGGDCRLNYRYVFNLGDKAEQAKGLEAELINAVTSVVEVVGGKVVVQGVQQENLLDVDELNITVEFSLPNVMSFPAKERALADCVSEIGDLRKKVLETKIPGAGDVKDTAAAVRDVLMKYLPKSYEKKDGDVLPGFPDCANAINVLGFFDRGDKFIKVNHIPVDEDKNRHLKELWNKIGDARFPWQRYRALDNDALVNRTKALGAISDGVKRFKVFLDQRHADCVKKLEPFIDAYERNDVFNKPYIVPDLTNRVALASGIVRASATFRDEADVEPAVLEKADENFTFTWVRWTLVVGDGADRDGERDRSAGRDRDVHEEPLTLERLADCARRALELGPGYALDKVKVIFRADGHVSGAVLEGLLPVKKTEKKKGEAVKEATDHVD